MTRQKKGFWLFIFSLIPGAGEMYMGFMKQGISIMLLFCSIFALCAGTGMDWLLMFFPIIWFYSFFNVHNLKSLPEDEFYAIEDNYILHLDELIGDANHIVGKYRTLVAIGLIIFGISILWNNFTDILYWILPDFLANIVSRISYQLPQIIIALVIIITGFYLLSDKKRSLDNEMDETQDKEAFWDPVQPYHQPQEPRPYSSPDKPEDNIVEYSPHSQDEPPKNEDVCG